MATEQEIKRNRLIVFIICFIITLAVPLLAFFYADGNSIIFPVICGIILLLALKAGAYLFSLFPIVWFLSFWFIVNNYCSYAELQIDNRTGKKVEVKIDYDFYTHSLGIFEPSTFDSCEIRAGEWDVYAYEVSDNAQELIDTVWLTISGGGSRIYNIAGAETYKIDYKQYGNNHQFMGRTKKPGFPKYISDKIIDLDDIAYDMRYIFEVPPDVITVEVLEQYSDIKNAIGHEEYYIVRASKEMVE